MKKALGSWSAMRKYLEQEMMASSLCGRIRYNCTTYVGMDGFCVFEVFVDGECFKRFSWETVNSYFINNGYAKKTKPMDTRDYWMGFHKKLSEYPIYARTEYTDEEFCEALKEYRNNSIQESVYSSNPIVLMFAVFDKRVGKRTLEVIKERMKSQPKWLQVLYQIRIDSEKLNV